MLTPENVFLVGVFKNVPSWSNRDEGVFTQPQGEEKEEVISISTIRVSMEKLKD